MEIIWKFVGLLPCSKSLGRKSRRDPVSTGQKEKTGSRKLSSDLQTNDMAYTYQ